MINEIPQNITDSQAIKRMVAQSKTGTWDGIDITPYWRSCAHYWPKYEASIFFTRDVGHHSGGWWKNPDFERCYHFSLSFVDKFGNSKPHNSKQAEKLVKMFYGYNHKLVWCEPPYSQVGLNLEVWHYRLFCDEAWRAIKPRGEVYSKVNTPPEWKSFSEIQDLNRKV